MNKNAYLVLSVKQLRGALKQAVADQRREKADQYHCIVLRDIQIVTDSQGDNQISCASVDAAFRKACSPPPVVPPAEVEYAFRFIGGGYNSVRATTLPDARLKAHDKFGDVRPGIDYDSFQRLGTAAKQKAYYASLPTWD